MRKYTFSLKRLNELFHYLSMDSNFSYFNLYLIIKLIEILLYIALIILSSLYGIFNLIEKILILCTLMKNFHRYS